MSYTHGAFAGLFYKWALAQLGHRSEPEIERQLHATYNDAWQHGDVNDRLEVLGFIYRKQISEDYGLFLVGLVDAERAVANDAVNFIEGLLIKRWRFPPDLRVQLQAYAARFEDGEKDIWPALFFLDRNEAEHASNS